MINSVSQIQDLYELSPMQQGMLFHSLYAPETGIYFEQRHCLLEGRLNIPAFKQAWQQVVDRYDVLRSEFHWEETDQPVQVVYQTAQLPWTEADWQSLDNEQQSQQLETFLVSERRQGFQLDQAPLMRCALFQLSDKTYRFVWSYHHLLMDGWCNGILIKEVLALYRASCANEQISLPAVKPYRDYIEWLQRQDKNKAEQYWKRALQGLSEPTSLGIEIVEQDTVEQDLEKSGGTSREWQSHRALQSEENQFLSPSLSAALRDLSKQSRLTLNTLFHGAWSILLSRYSGQTDVLFGATVSGRPPALVDVESMVGLFINAVPVRSQISSQATLRSWLESLQQSQRDRETYSYASLTDIQSWSDLPGNCQLFESLLVFENYPLSIEAVTQDMGVGFTLKDAQGYEQTNYPLTLVIIPGETIQLSLRYDALRICPAAVARMVGHLEVILESFTRGLEQKIEEISLLTQSEQQQLTTQGQGESVDIPDLCVHQQIEQQTQQTPDARAILFSTGSTSEDSKNQTTLLTFQQLNHRANQIAHYLIEQGIQTGSRVGLFLPRSLDMIAALLAILKAGGTYIPLDPSHPAERTRHIVADAQLTAVISYRDIARTLSLPTGVAAFCLDQQCQNIQTQPTENPACSVSKEDIAYILYTSGSTGKPKGVMIRHRSLTNFLAAMAAVTRITCEDTWLAVTTLGFDIAALEIFLPLLTGACLVVTPTAVTIDGQQLIEQINAHQITLMQATPSTWRLLIDAGWCGKPALRAFCGGEALDLSLAQQLLPQVNELWNLYGPTETTIWSGALQLTPAHLTNINARNGSAPIGSPLQNTQFYVLDAQRKQVPFGIAGELYIGGAGVGAGYWQRSELSNERFVQVPGLTDEQLYQTGDRVRYNEDGTLTYLGRLDYQIKLRGYRIELGEIEAILNQHPKITQAIVTLTESNNPQLVAYLRLSSAVSIEETNKETGKETDFDKIDRFKADLRQWLAQRLPAYMIPSGYVVLNAFPLTPNGKIDRRSLPLFTPEVTGVEAAKTPHQELISGIWAEVLEVKTVSLSDDFFALGGHSLLATRAVAQVRQILGIDIPLRTLFEHSTLEDFCTQAQHLQQQPLPPIAPVNELTLSSAQRRQWLMAQLAPESAAYTVPIAIQLEGELSVMALKQSITQVVARHETLQTIYPAVDGQPVPTKIGTTLEADALPVKDLTYLDKKAQTAAVKQQIRQQARSQFDLEQGPLWTALLLQLSDRKHILILSFHHITIDGWSIGILLKELTALYQASQSDQDLSQILQPLPVTYSDYAAWQQSLNLNDQRTYWQQQLSGLAPLLAMPTDYARGAAALSEGSSYEFRLSQSETVALQRFSQQNKATLFMTLMAAFKALLYRYSGCTDLAIGTPIANRQRPELEGLMGLFVNTLVIRTPVQDNPTFLDLLEQVRSVTLDAYSHQDFPFEQLVDELDIPRTQSHTPLVQVLFSLQNSPLSSTKVSGLDWSPIAVETTTAKFDLSLDIRETERGLVGRWEYRTDLFSADTIHRMAGHFRTLLRHLPEAAESRLSALPLLSASEIKQLKSWQQGRCKEQLPSETIHQHFEAQVKATPAAIALIYGDQQLTYQALNQRANRLAHYLRDRLEDSRIQCESPVGIWAERSHHTIISILAVLKAGGTYIPLDPQYPLARLDWMVKDTRMALLLTHLPSMAVPAEIQAQVPTLDVGTLTTELEELSTKNLPIVVDARLSKDTLAYILYTSGSTGQPKGVCVPHRGVIRLVHSPNYVSLTPEDVLLQAAPLTFDASTFEMWGALLNGGKLVLLQVESPSLEDLASAITAHNVTILWLTSGLFNLMVDEQLDALKPVKQLLAGGDVLSILHLRKALHHLKETRIINGYGPTEGTTFTCCHTVTESNLGASVPIGRPIQHTQVYVLDRDLQQVPMGIPGELYIGGAGIAQGYLNQPALTAERFIPNPFSSVFSGVERSEYLYKTGDRVRYRPDGAIEYLGRIDQQVKIRGFRIEPGEIATALETHSSIDQAVITVSGEAAGEKRLIAYLEATSTEQPSMLALRAHLLALVPDYMVPAKFIWLSDLPLTPNGKIDKRALPEPDWQLEAKQNQQHPQTDVEQTLADIWSTLLPAETVGVHDNFFELGGDSILAMQIVSRAQQAGISLSPQRLFQYQTIAELARVAETSSEPTITQSPAEGRVPLTPIQHWFFAQQLSEPSHFNQSVFLALPNGVDREALQRAIALLYHHHDALRLRFSQTAAGWQQHYAPVSGEPSTHWFNFSELALSKQDAAIAKEAKHLHSSLDLQQGPLVAIAGFKLGECRSSQLLIVIHHLVVDGLSWRILLADLHTAYQQVAAGKQPQLAPKAHTYQQWASELTQRAEQVIGDYDYWLRLTQIQQSNCLKPHVKQQNTIGNSRLYTAQLSTSATQALLTQVSTAYNTQITETLLVALSQTLTDWLQTQTVIVALESYGRLSEKLDVSRTVGWFTALYPAQLTFDNGLSLGENIQAIKAQLREIPSQGLSYGLLRYLGQRSELELDLPMSFNYLGQLDGTEEDIFRRVPGPRLNQANELNQADENVRSHLIDLNCWIEDSQLRLHWTYSPLHHSSEQIAIVAQQFINNLEALIQHCCEHEASYASTDFDLVQLDQSALESVLTQVSFDSDLAEQNAAQEVSP